MVKYKVTDYRVSSSRILLYVEGEDRPKQYNGMKLDNYELEMKYGKQACFTEDCIYYTDWIGAMYRMHYTDYSLDLDYPDEWFYPEELTPFEEVCSLSDESPILDGLTYSDE